MQPKVIRIDGVIGTGDGEVSAQMVRDQLPINGTDPIVVKIHSEGGSVFEGFAIHDLLSGYQGAKSLSIESSAFSIASFIAMAFDDVEISSNGYMMLHNPYAMVEGDDEDLAKQSELLGKLKNSMVAAYATRSGKTEDEIKAILKNETYLDAQQAVSMGFASRIANQPVVGRPFAKCSHMPHGVVAALFGAGSDGANRETEREKPMPDSQPVAATLKEIKAAFPKASNDFVVKCLEKSLPMASVATAAVEELMAENEELKAKISAMEEEHASKAAASEGGMEEEEEEEEEVAAPEARAKGVKPIAKAKAAGPSAKERWLSHVHAHIERGMSRAHAIDRVEREHPGLREQYVIEVNAAR